MFTAARLVLLVAVSGLLASLVSAQQCTGDPFCTTVSATSITDVSVQLTFYYQKTGPGPAGMICGINTNTINPSTISQAIPGQTPKGAAINTISGTVTVIDNNGAIYVTDIDATFTTGSGTKIVTGRLSGDIDPDPANLAATLKYPPFISATTYPQGEAISSTTVDGCNGAGTGDPRFSGFRGQQFSLIGEADKVYNIISSSTMQLNTRLVELAKGEALDRSAMRLARLKSLFSLPETVPFDHPGPYMGELGFVTVDGHQLYARAGAYQYGWDVVTLDNANFTAASSVVLGSGEDQVTIFRPSTHQLVIDTSLLSFTITNSDHFLNLDRAELKHGYKSQPLGGTLGHSASLSWRAHNNDSKWRKEVEQDALVESNDLFEMTPLPAAALSV